MTTNNGTGPASVEDKVKVAVRVRPFSRRETNTRNVVNAAGETIYLAHPRDEKPPRPFSFDFCFHAGSDGHTNLDNSVDSVDSSASGESQSAAAGNASQEQVFRAVGTQVVDSAFLGFNTCVFAYGQTGSGKSHTMMGSPEEPGLVPRLCTELFRRAARETSESSRFKVEVSFFEVYNERIRDLLGSKRQSLRVREHSLFGPMVEGLSVFVVNNYAQVELLMAEGNGARATAATLMNDQSSRSHSVFTIKLTQTISDAADKTFTGEKVSKISLVDLAGSERVQKTGATGKRLEEGGNINRSLTALGKVISALAAKGGHNEKGGAGNFVPYRDSVLTWLLKENLGGNSRTTMIATVSPSADNYEETLSTLRFADRAKRIQTHAVVNEDPNAKIIRELREEVEHLRLLNQSQAKQREHFQAAIEQIAERHQADKQKALEQQYEQFAHYIRELTQNLATPSASSTPMTPFGGGGFSSMTPSASVSNGLAGVGWAGSLGRAADVNNNNGGGSKGKFLAWAQQRAALFSQRLAALRSAIQRATALTAEANSLIQLLAQSQSRQHRRGHPHPLCHYSVSLHIPAANLRPSKLNEMAEEGGEGGCVCEPVIVVSWEGEQRLTVGGTIAAGTGQQQLSMEQMECKLAELRMAASNLTSMPSPLQGDDDETNYKSVLPFFGNFCTKRESHSLIGVANVCLAMLFHDLPPLDIQVLIVNQQGEICGKLHVQVQRLALLSESMSEDSGNSCESTDELEFEEGAADERPERFLGRTMLCRVEIKKATNLPSEQANLVFCQYQFHDQPQVVVPSEPGERQGSRHCSRDSASTIHFQSPNEFQFVCTRPFLDYVEEDALSIEVWGHRCAPDGEEDPEEEAEAEVGVEPEGFDGEWERLDECWVEQAAAVVDGGGARISLVKRSASEQQNVWQVAERKKKSLQQRWQEVTKRLDLWLEILELDADGQYAPVPVDSAENAGEGSCATGGVYRLRQGQQRRIRISVAQHSDGEGGALPLLLDDIQSVSVGSILLLQNDDGQEGTEVDGGGGTRHQQMLDSYQELDLARLREQWEEVLRSRANYLRREIQTLNLKGAVKSRLEAEREQSLLLNWVELVEERNAISVPTAGIPGAPPPPLTNDGDGIRRPVANYECHCPLLFLQPSKQSQDDSSSSEVPNADGECDACESPQLLVTGEKNCLPFEDEESHLELAIAEKEVAENRLSCICPWDSSLHGCPAMNRPSRGNERLFLIVKMVIRISQPVGMAVVLRKRLAIQLFANNAQQQQSAATGGSRWPLSLPWSRREQCQQPKVLSGTGLLVDVVGCIPQSALDFESRQMLARLAVQHATDAHESGRLAGKDVPMAEDEREEQQASEMDTANGPLEQQQQQQQNYLSEYVSKTIQAVEWLIKMDRLRQEEAISRALTRHRRIQVRPSCSARNLKPSLCHMKRTISLPTTMNNFLSASTSFHNNFETIPDRSGESSLAATPEHQLKEKAGHERVANLMQSSQSHSEGFGHIMASGSSPNSSGYASLANSLIHPCGALRLTGIEEESSRVQQQVQAQPQEKQPSSMAAENATNILPHPHSSSTIADPVVVGSSQATPNSNPNSSPEKATSTTSSTSSTIPGDNCSNQNNALPPAAVNNENALATEVEVAPTQVHHPSTSSACCCENRLFSPLAAFPPPPVVHQQQQQQQQQQRLEGGGGNVSCPATRKLFFQNTINASTAVANCCSSSPLAIAPAAIMPMPPTGDGNNGGRATMAKVKKMKTREGQEVVMKAATVSSPIDCGGGGPFCVANPNPASPFPPAAANMPIPRAKVKNFLPN